MKETIFDKILRGDIPSDKVYEDEEVLAFRDVNPQAPVHILVIPKLKCQFFSELKNRETDYVGAFFKKVSLVAGLAGLDKEGYRIVINEGKNGQQSVDYLHAHILGGKPLSWPPG